MEFGALKSGNSLFRALDFGSSVLFWGNMVLLTWKMVSAMLFCVFFFTAFSTLGCFCYIATDTPSLYLLHRGNNYSVVLRRIFLFGGRCFCLEAEVYHINAC
jgi:hypothetical protein